MRRVFEARASTILYRLGAAQPDARGVYLLPANICPVVPLALVAAQRRFEFVDLDPETLSVDGTLLRRRVEAAKPLPVAGVIYARTYGAPADAGPLFAELKQLRPDILLVDDRCLSLPVPDPEDLDWQGSDVVLFSTGYSKPVDLDSGGFAYLRDRVPYARRRRDFDPGDLERVTALYKRHIRSGTPVYGPASEARVRPGLERLRWLDCRTPVEPWPAYRDRVLAASAKSRAHRCRINGLYRASIPQRAQLDAGYHGWRFQLRVANPALLQRRIGEAGLFASRHYFPSAVLFGGHPSPVASNLHAQILNLFNDLRISEPAAERLARIVRRHVESEVDTLSPAR